MTGKPSYLWETHMHTTETSICGQTPAARMVRAYHDAGYHGVVVTDHFINGNSHAGTMHGWTARVDAMMCGYRAAKATGNALGMAVLLGTEFSDPEGGDFLTYGLPEAFYYDQPGLDQLTIDAFARKVRAAGGFVSQAHPFRQQWYMPAHIDKRYDIVDGIEVFNGSHAHTQRDWDDKALALAERHGLIHTAGSDAHSLHDVATAALAFDAPFDTDAAFLEALRLGQGRVVRNRA